MMKKRKSPTAGGDDSDSEMNVDGEEKVEMMEDDNDEDESDEESDDEERNPGSAEDNSFMDNFYGLSSSDASERAQAANAILHHCLVGPEANTKDAAYALRRILNGLCSGRAASRQGNASAFASFLKVAVEGGQLKEIQIQDTDEEAKKEASILGYVRHRLIKATDSSASQGKKKGSEERDYQFGRLFGILSVARSGILLPHGDKSCDSDEILEVSRGFVSDLIELYSQKNWMREPAAHAIGTSLKMFYSDRDTKDIALQLVEELVIPKLLQNDSTSVKDYEAEQIAVALTIQSHKGDHKNGLPSPLDKPILSSETMPSIAKVLVETSSVALPRTHLVWDALWLYLTEPENGPLQRKTGTRLGIRKLRDKPLVGTNSTQDIVESLVRTVIVEGLLKADGDDSGRTTHEKRALALCLVRNLFGAPFNSSITSATKIQLEAEDLESILTPLIVRKLFLDVICAGGGNAKKAHTLKPLALQILESMVDSLSQDASEAGMERRFRMAKSFIKCEPRFDTVTKTTTVSDLVGLNQAKGGESGTSPMSAVQKYFDFLEEEVMSSNDGDLLNYLELLYQSSKRLLRHETGGDDETDEFEEFALKTVARVVGFFMAGSFFDCSHFSPDKQPGSGKKGKKGKKAKAKPSVDKNPVAEAAARLKQLGKKRGKGVLSYDIRLILSERFYSLLAEYVNASIRARGGDTAKDSIMLDILSVMCSGWKAIEAGGAKPLFPAIESGDDEDESQSPQEMVFLLQGLANDLVANAEKNPDDATLRARKRCATGCAALASALFLHLLGCGKPEDLMDEEVVTTEDDDDSADIVDALEGMAELMPLILGDSETSEDNPLAGFAEVFIGVFSSRVSSGSPGRGSSPRLIREAIKFAWMGVLAASATSNRDLLDSDVVSVLLNGVGAGGEGPDHGEGDNEEEAEHDSSNEDMDDDDSSSDNELADFSKVGNILDGDDEDDDQGDSDGDDTSERQGADDEQDVEIDPEKLNSLLEDDSDAEIDAGELEHHEGADAALAMLIKMKQEARKASRQAREKLEIEKQLRCTLLLETLLGKSESWMVLFRCDVILGMALPLLTYRKQIETSLLRSSGKANTAEISAKRGMLDRLTSILKSKLFKLKVANMPSCESVDKVEYCESLASSLMEMAQKSSSKDQRACCSAGLVCVVKAIPDMDGIIKVSSVYGSAVEEWATKRTSRLEVSMFDDLINHCPSVAQATLIIPLSSAATTARSPFLRCESYRLLAALFNPKLNPQSSELDTLTIKKAGDSASQTVAAIIAGLKDDEMQKAKRVREILKAAEKILEFAKAHGVVLPDVNDLSAAIAEVGAKVNNQGVKSAVEKTNAAFDALKQDVMEVDDDKVDNAEAEEREDDGTRSKSKKDKKKKKKRGKK